MFFRRRGEIQGLLKEFVGYLENYEVVEESEKKLYEKRTGSVSDPARRRELKIQQYKKEKDLRAKIEVCSPSGLVFRLIDPGIS